MCAEHKVFTGFLCSLTCVFFVLSVKANPPANTYYILDPETQNHPLVVYSYTNNNAIQAGSTTLILSSREYGTIPAGSDLAPGTKIEGLGPFLLGSNRQTVDVPSPATLLGTQFVIPHIRNAHKVYLTSPSGDAAVTVEIAGVVNNLSLTQGNVFEYGLGSDNTVSTIVESDVPILVTHVAESGGSRLDAFPVAPTARELWGIRSKNALIGVASDNTNITVYTSNGNTQTFLLNRGDRQLITVGSNASEGAGSGIHILADQPIAAVQYADSDGSEATSFLPTNYLSNHVGIPVGAQYVAITCPYGNTTVTLYHGSGPLDTQNCSGIPANYPGKAFFGSTTDGLNIPQGAYFRSSKPVFSYVEVTNGNEEKQLFGSKNSYVVLSPWTSEAALSIVSLEDSNTIEAGGTSLFLNKNNLGNIPAGVDLVQGAEIRGAGAFDVGSIADGTDMPVPNSFLGSQFSIPHLRGYHTYDLLSPIGDATVEITLGATTQTINLSEGQVTSFDAGNDNLIAGVIKSNRLIYVYHRATSAQGTGTRYDAYPVPPADNKVWSVRSNSLIISATEDATTASAYSDTGETQVIALQAGDRAEVTIGSSVSQGEGSAIYVQADKPVNVIGYEDGDGAETVSAWPSAFRGVYFGIPVDTQYVSVICPNPNTEVTLTDGVNPPEIQNCGATGLYPGKTYFGSNANGTHVSAGATISSSQPIFLYYESSATDDAKNLLGTLNASPNPVAAQLTATPESGNAPLDVFFDGSASTSTNTITSYTWDFGDGNTDTGATVSHSYADAGTYLVSLTVEDNLGATDQATFQVNVNPPAPGQVLINSGIVNLVNDSWQTVTLSDTFTSMIVVATVVLPDQASVPAVARVRNATGNQFEVKLQNPSGLPVSGYDVHYVAAEEGQYNETEHGINMEAVKLDSTITASKGSWLRQVSSFYNTYTNPVVVGQVMSENDPNWSVFWASSDTSQTNIPSGPNLAAGKHVAEDSVSSRNDETVGYIVLEAGSYNIDGTDLLAGVGADTVRGVGNSASGYSYSISGVSNPETAILSTAAMDGGDGGWPVLFGAAPVSASSLRLAVDEDQISDSERSHTTEQVAYLIVSTQSSNAAPTASFSANSTSGFVPLTVNADATGSSDSDGAITNYAWNFGDGNTDTGITTSHQYTAAGNYTLTLTVTDDDGATDQTSLPITVNLPNQAPTASFTANPTSGDAPLTVNVDAAGSSDSDGTITNYDWDFGDGNTETGVTSSHQYTSAGNYTLTLTVTDNDGTTNQSTLLIPVTEPNEAPTASFTANPTSGDAPLTVNVDAAGSSDSDGTITNYDWDFGDGNTETGVTSSHQYTTAGNYTLTLTVIDDDGATDQSTNIIAVQYPGGNPPNSPVVSTPSGSSLDNPATIEGSADPDTVIRVYANGVQMNSTVSDSLGTFTVTLPLNHGANNIYTTAFSNNLESAPSNSITLDFVNTLGSEQGGTTITSQVVWAELPGGVPYTISAGDVRVENGGELIILPGVRVEVSGGNRILALSKFKANGTAVNPIIFTSGEATPNPGDWEGIVIGRDGLDHNIEITHTIIEYGDDCVSISNGLIDSIVLSNNEIRNCLSDGVYFQATNINTEISHNHLHSNGHAGVHVALGLTNPIVKENVIENNLYGIFNIGTGWVTSFPYGSPNGISTPTIENNTVRMNQYGVHLRYRVIPAITGNTISENDIGIYMNGGRSETILQDLEPPLPIIHNNNFFDNYTVNGDGSLRRLHIETKNFFRGAVDTIDVTGNWWGSANPADVPDQMIYTNPFIISSNTRKPFIDYSGFLDGPLPGGQPAPGNFIFYIDQDITLLQDTKYVFVEREVRIPSGVTVTVEPGAELEFSVPTPNFSSESNERVFSVVGSLILNGTQSNPIKIYSASNVRGSWRGISLYTGGSSIDMDYTTLEHARFGIQVQAAPINLSITNSSFRKNIDALDLGGSGSLNIQSTSFSDNINGIVLAGDYIGGQITGNNIANNYEKGLYVNGPVNSAGPALDVTNNWWGNAPPIYGEDVYFTSASWEPGVDYGNHVVSPIATAFPIEAGPQETRVQGCFLDTINWDISIQSSTGVVEQFSGNSQCLDVSVPIFGSVNQ